MIRALVVGQTPPPYGGQAVSIQLMLDGKYSKVKMYHVRMAFSAEMDEVGKFNVGKVYHLFSVILSIIYSRFRYRTPVLYYVPAGPDRVPMYRDLVILILTRWLFRKVVFQFRAAGLSEIYGRLFWYEKALFRLAYFHPDLAIRLSEFTPEDGKFLKAKKEVIVPNGMVDIFAEVGDASRRYKSESNLLYVGVLRESKGVMVLLEASKMLKDDGFSFKLRFMGKFESTEFEEAVRSYVKENNLADYIEFLGVLTGDEKWSVYNETDIFVLPSFFESEAMPRTVIEAMSFEIPIVATKWRGIPSLVEEGKSGFLVSIKDSEAIAEKTAVLLKDAALRQAMGKRGREIYLERFTAEKFWRNMEEAFLTVDR